LRCWGNVGIFNHPRQSGTCGTHMLCDIEFSVVHPGEARAMLKFLIRGSVSLLKWVLCGVGVLALMLLALLATPLQPVPELQSISRTRATVDLSSLPAIERFQGRDGTWLGFRHYGAGGAPTGRVAIVIHGSSGSSGGTIHALSQALAAHGVETFAVDMRGHGTSGTRGDIGYVGQLEDDLADFVAVLRN